MSTKIRIINLGRDALEVTVLPKDDAGFGTIQIIPEFRSVIFPVDTKLRLVVNELSPGNEQTLAKPSAAAA